LSVGYLLFIYYNIENKEHMTFKKKITSRFKLMLRHLGMLCKQPREPKTRIRISKTLNPDGTTTVHDRITEQPLNEGNTFETELHIWNEIHKPVNKSKTNK
jgi:hypothetical protein